MTISNGSGRDRARLLRSRVAVCVEVVILVLLGGVLLFADTLASWVWLVFGVTVFALVGDLVNVAYLSSRSRRNRIP
jgi:hypothetical protein